MKQAIIEFQGTKIKTVKHTDGKVYVSLAHLCAGVGVSLPAQYKKMRINPDLFHPCSMAMMRNGGRHLVGQEYKMVMIPLDRVNTWLLSIAPNRCKPMVRSTILHYQKECANALYDYWHKGVAVNPRATEPTKAKPEFSSEKVMAIRELIQLNREMLEYIKEA